MVTLEEIRRFMNKYDLNDSIVCLHSSFKSFGEVRGGPETIIRGFLQNGATLVCPAFFYKSETYPPHRNYERNGVDYGSVHDLAEESYEDGDEQIDPSMGIIPKMLIRYPGAVRTKNPSNSFVAAGVHASMLTEDQSLLNAYSIYKRIYSGVIPAYVVLAGVDFTSCTPIHFAEELSGKKLFRRWALYHDEVVEVEVGSCSEGFERIAEYTKDIERTTTIGAGKIRLFGFREFIDTVSEIIKKNPDITHCQDEKCIRCRDMALGGLKRRS